ncbi:MAG: flagellar basal body rod protein FlgC [Pseudomonadota bacterium]|jgi:flagellar basal-body rod protein FlgC|uniref:Flagellar basal-body rod protein FlgC n=1 Tax=Pseudooceanicola nitratireducens TaxID=517719 RepID=A0A1I1Q2S2_9RHOB|nr:flagellar basal body rod protein FlgC [Pseudooceanicola nitratireducens]MEC7297106.1 flagellar basal body rod protein FlgC [Pseudomonadota bacterium]MBY6159154.1 flagellar basal body rod protein FlgC [Pseudooceanicola nitratireducens]MBY6167484.1 flagellar basal body rod protein FlgC [Pseudooceanicola nitratireducens]MEC7795020.1 flagellar basal body rod protein FlgC [Pseudomonadota bacterium]MEC8666950.1 flagellar basal body rod protein FlgC [Pseudomonadota bacterium]
MDPLKSILDISASGMLAQGERLKVVSENVANASSVGASPGEDPYRRKTITFEEMVNRETGVSTVHVASIDRDNTDFSLRYEPSHPAANEQGFIKVSNVSTVMEMANMREAARSYEANMNMFEAARRMRSQIIDLLK